MINKNRIRTIKTGKHVAGPVVYWMSRDQRTDDNWALLYAQEQAMKSQVPLTVVFTLAPEFSFAAYRQYIFMIDGLKKVESALARKNIEFHLIAGKPHKIFLQFVRAHHAGLIVTDFSSLRIHLEWKKKVADTISIPFFEVDAHNIVPVWTASDKLEYGAYTIRPKIRKLLPEYLEEFPKLKRHPYNIHIAKKGTDWDDVVESLHVDKNVRKVDWLKPGEEAAKKTLEVFLDERLYNYDARRNDPNENAQSDLSPYIHFGQISAQRVALEAERYGRFVKSTEAFLEELIVRRELSDNYCYYNPDYDNLRRLPKWSSETLSTHRRDKREYIYTADEFEHASTHDRLWNAAQREMVRKGKMHGYMRMYWAKKISEWSKTPEEAMQTAIYLNDRYELDGRDPNGYAGIAWSIGGVHDRPWFERPVYGKIRSMTYAGCKRKFDVEKYISVNCQ